MILDLFRFGSFYVELWTCLASRADTSFVAASRNWPTKKPLNPKPPNSRPTAPRSAPAVHDHQETFISDVFWWRSVLIKTSRTQEVKLSIKHPGDNLMSGEEVIKSQDKSSAVFQWILRRRKPLHQRRAIKSPSRTKNKVNQIWSFLVQRCDSHSGFRWKLQFWSCDFHRQLPLHIVMFPCYKWTARATCKWSILSWITLILAEFVFPMQRISQNSDFSQRSHQRPSVEYMFS